MSPPETPLRLVAIDDNRVNLEIIELTLELIEAEVELFEDGAAALRHLAESPEPPAALIVDRLMPGMPGLEVVRALRAMPRFAHMKILMASASADPAEIAAGHAAGVDRYLVKPFAPQELLDAIEQMLAD